MNRWRRHYRQREAVRMRKRLAMRRALFAAQTHMTVISAAARVHAIQATPGDPVAKAAAIAETILGMYGALARSPYLVSAPAPPHAPTAATP